MTRAYELRLELQNHFDIPDSRGTINAGISSAANWFNGLSSNDQFILVEYLIREHSLSPSLRLGDLETLILLARISINQAFLPLLAKFLNHAKSLEEKCTEAIGWLQPYTYEQLCDDLLNAINLTQDEIHKTATDSVLYYKLQEVVKELSDIRSGLNTLKTVDEEYHFDRIAHTFLPYQNYLRHLLERLDINIRYRYKP